MTEERMEGQVSLFDQDSWCGKTSREPSPVTKGKTSKPSSRKSSASKNRILPMCLCLTRGNGQSPDASTMRWEDGALLGEYTMHSFGESPNEENASLLSQILEDSAPPKYSLSAKACLGILRRAERRGKELPAELKLALLRQSRSKNEQESQGGGKGILIQNEKTGALSTFNNQSVLRAWHEPTYCLQGNGIDRADTAGCNGRGWTEDVSYTLNTIDRPAVMAVDCRNGTEAQVNGTLQAKSNGGVSHNLNNVIRVNK